MSKQVANGKDSNPLFFCKIYIYSAYTIGIMLELAPTKNVLPLLVFLESSGIDFKVTDIPGLALALIPEINNPRLTPSLIANLKLNDVLQYLPESFDTFKKEVRNIEDIVDGSKYRLPTAAFKSFCGNECLTPRGMISRNYALECVMRHIKINGLIDKDEYLIHLDEMLRDALQTYIRVTTLTSLEYLVERVFV